LLEAKLILFELFDVAKAFNFLVSSIRNLHMLKNRRRHPY